MQRGQALLWGWGGCPVCCHLISSISGLCLGFLGGAVVKNLPAGAGAAEDTSSIPGLGRSPGVGNGSLLQYSYLENSMGRGGWWVRVHGVTPPGFPHPVTGALFPSQMITENVSRCCQVSPGRGGKIGPSWEPLTWAVLSPWGVHPRLPALIPCLAHTLSGSARPVLRSLS